VNIDIDTYVLVDLETGGFIERPAGSTGADDEPLEPPDTEPPDTEPPDTEPPDTEPPVLGSGDVQVTLTWTGDVDVDLHVIDPNGEEIYFGAPTSSSGGQLDVDQIPGEGETGTHVENVFWPTGGAPAGSYQAFVRGLGGYVSTTADYELEIFVEGELVVGDGGVLDGNGTSVPIDFEFAP
jgi:hypothetical protein